MDNMRRLGELMHYGTPRHSGRYPWGSGENPYQRTQDFMARYQDLTNKYKKAGLSDEEVRKAVQTALNMSQSQIASYKSVANYERRKAELDRIVKMKDEDGKSWTQIGRAMNLNESSVRDKYDQAKRGSNDVIADTADRLRKLVSEKGPIDVGEGTEQILGVKSSKLDSALLMLELEGYNVYNQYQVQQAGTNHKTTVKTLAPSDVSIKELYDHPEMIKSIADYESDATPEVAGFKRTKLGLYSPESISSDRVKIITADEGGSPKDGVIELRKGIEDISLGESSYAQVRIAVNGTHYLKGMAMYGRDEDFPPGVDIIFYSSKPASTPAYGEDKTNSITKPLKKDPDNPFGATVLPLEKGGQRFYTDENGETKLSVINKVNDEGAWGDWSKTLASQFLAKQQPTLAKRQLDLSLAQKDAEYEDIMNITNPVLRKKMLAEFADDCDASAVHLKAAALPRQKSQVVLPVIDMPSGQIYAPNYKTGEHVCLVRYPHTGIFEIPELVVNNNFKPAKDTIGNAIDAVGINLETAHQLSGADFDGDSVLVIPTNDRVRISNRKPLEGLKDFSPDEYKANPPGSCPLPDKQKQMEMGKVSNLITDMTIKGANEEEITRAVKHSMVIIDAQKHDLDWKKSEEENGIIALRKYYQGENENGQPMGASTLLSRAKSEERVNSRSEYAITDRETGEKIYTYKYKRAKAGQPHDDQGYLVDKNGLRVPETYSRPKTKYVIGEDGKKHKEQVIGEDGKVVWEEVKKTVKTTKMAEAKDAFDLSSGSRIETIYATYANELKGRANSIRLQVLEPDNYQYSASNAETYSKEVESVLRKLDAAKSNAPRERMAQLYAESQYKAKLCDNPEMEYDQKKKIKSQALIEGRARFGAKKSRITFTDKEWDAVNANAFKKNQLNEIFKNADSEELTKRAMPKHDDDHTVTKGQIAWMKAASRSGATIAEIAEELGYSTSTVGKYIKGE